MFCSRRRWLWVIIFRGDTDRILTLMGTLLALEGQYEEEGQSGKGKPQAIDDGSVESFG